MKKKMNRLVYKSFIYIHNYKFAQLDEKRSV